MRGVEDDIYTKNCNVRREGKGLLGDVHIDLGYNKTGVIARARMCSGCSWLG
jgi:hypothetical protein